MGLWDRIQDKRKQAKRDTTQDDEINKLKAQFASSQKRLLEKTSSNSSSDSSEKDDVAASLQRSRALISREFDDGYEQLGRSFAVGDVVTENRLQAQVIALQQTVIDVLQDALYHGRQLDRADMARLVAASDSAREGSLGALRQQRQRLMAAEEPQHHKKRPSPPPPAIEYRPGPEPLFCPYSLDLQHSRDRRLAAAFAPGGDCACPACGTRLPAEAGDCWVIGKRVTRLVVEGAYRREVDEDVEFVVDQRFVVKSHTPDGEYACVFCSRHGHEDVLSGSAEALVKHIGRAHHVSELERELFMQRAG